MAIPSGAAVEAFNGFETVSGTTSSIDYGAFSVSGDVSSWTNSENAARAAFVLACSFGVAPVAGGAVNLYARHVNLESANNGQTPSSNNRSHWLGAFVLDAVTTAQYCVCVADLPNAQDAQQYEFYLENLAGNARTVAADWVLKINAKACAPKS